MSTCRPCNSDATTKPAAKVATRPQRTERQCITNTTTATTNIGASQTHATAFRDRIILRHSSTHHPGDLFARMPAHAKTTRNSWQEEDLHDRGCTPWQSRTRACHTLLTALWHRWTFGYSMPCRRVSGPAAQTKQPADRSLLQRATYTPEGRTSQSPVSGTTMEPGGDRETPTREYPAAKLNNNDSSIPRPQQARRELDPCCSSRLKGSMLASRNPTLVKMDRLRPLLYTEQLVTTKTGLQLQRQHARLMPGFALQDLRICRRASAYK